VKELTVRQKPAMPTCETSEFRKSKA
jgi:hypothetical protein